MPLRSHRSTQCCHGWTCSSPLYQQSGVVSWGLGLLRFRHRGGGGGSHGYPIDISVLLGTCFDTRTPKPKWSLQSPIAIKEKSLIIIAINKEKSATHQRLNSSLDFPRVYQRNNFRRYLAVWVVSNWTFINH